MYNFKGVISKGKNKKINELGNKHYILTKGYDSQYSREHANEKESIMQ